MWRDKIVPALLISVLTALGAAGFQSAKYLLAFGGTFESELKDVEVQIHRDKLVLEHATDFERAIDQSLLQEPKRMDLLQGFATYESFKPSASRRDTYRQAAHELYQLNKGLGELSGYSPAATGLPIEFHEAVLNPLRAEIEAWEAIRHYASPLSTHSSDKEIAYEQFEAAVNREARAVSAAVSAGKSLDVYLEVQRSNNQLKRDRTFKNLHAMVKWYKIAWVSFFASVAIYLLLLRYTINVMIPKRTQTSLIVSGS